MYQHSELNFGKWLDHEGSDLTNGYIPNVMTLLGDVGN